jgi:RNA polymerase sigma-70 factor (ECF subfamily)
MAAYVAGNEAAFRQLFERYAPMLLRLTRRHLRDDELAQEIVQQTFFRLHGARNDFRQGSRLRPWVMTIAMNLVREHWRRAKRRKQTELEVDTQAAPTADFMPIELRQRSALLHGALEKLPVSQREVVELHWFQERPYAEIAEIVGTSEGAVRVRAHRAYTTLKQLLGSEIRGEE